MTQRRRKRRMTLCAKVTIAFNTALVAALPAFEYLIAALPQLQAHLPENTYRTVGLIAVIGNILINSYRAAIPAKRPVRKPRAVQ